MSVENSRPRRYDLADCIPKANERAFFKVPLVPTLRLQSHSLPKQGKKNLQRAARALRFWIDIDRRQFACFAARFGGARCNHICCIETDDLHFSNRILFHRIPPFLNGRTNHLPLYHAARGITSAFSLFDNSFLSKESDRDKRRLNSASDCGPRPHTLPVP